MSLKGVRVPVHDGGMNTIMDDTQIETVEQVRRFLAGSGAMKMAISSKTERYQWVQATLIRFEYLTLKKAERGVLLKSYSAKVCHEGTERRSKRPTDSSHAA